MDILSVMQAYGRDAANHARHRGIELDYTEASLEGVDAVLSILTRDGLLTPRTKEEEADVWTLSKVYGGYIGEVVLRELGGAWELQPLPGGGSRVVLRTHGIQAFPCEKIHARLTEEPLSGVGGYCRAIRKIMELQEQKP